MNKSMIALAAAPLALLAACGEGRVDEEDVALDPAGTGLESPELAAENLPDPTENSVETVDYSGTYTFTGLDGTISTITLEKEAGTYEYDGAGTVQASGDIETIDGSRIYLDGIGEAGAYFAVADGALYRLPNEETTYDQIDMPSAWVREGGASAGMDGEGMDGEGMGEATE